MNEKKKKEPEMQGGHKLSRQYRGVVITERDRFGLVDTCRKMSIMIIVIIIIITYHKKRKTGLRKANLNF